MNKALNLAAVIVATSCCGNTCSLDDTKLRALCSHEGVEFQIVKDFVEQAIGSESRDDMKELAMNAVIATAIAKGTDIGDELLKDVTIHYIKYKSALKALTERYQAEYSEEVVRLQGLVNKVAEEI